MYHHSISEPASTASVTENDENDLIKMFKLVNSIKDKPVDVMDLKRRFLSKGIRVTEEDLAYILKVCVVQLAPFFNQEFSFSFGLQLASLSDNSQQNIL